MLLNFVSLTAILHKDVCVSKLQVNYFYNFFERETIFPRRETYKLQFKSHIGKNLASFICIPPFQFAICLHHIHIRLGTEQLRAYVGYTVSAKSRCSIFKCSTQPSIAEDRGQLSTLNLQPYYLDFLFILFVLRYIKLPTY